MGRVMQTPMDANRTRPAFDIAMAVGDPKTVHATGARTSSVMA